MKSLAQDGIQYAILIEGSHSKDGIEFVTPDDYSLQLAYMKRPKAYEIIPHIHKTTEKITSNTQEVLFLKSGEVIVDFYDPTEKYVFSQVLKPGDVILLAEGGHGFEFIMESELIEVKQGPYSAGNDKTRFVRDPNTKREFI